MFQKLLNIIQHNISGIKTPLEDFTSELLVGVLSSKEEIKNNFINKFLKINGTGFKINTRTAYNHKGTVLYPDIVIKNEEYVCFIENKVDSVEHQGQLLNYIDVLNERSKKARLFYCTKHYDPKEYNQHHFKQFRWKDVYSFLETYQKDPLIDEFLHFLEHNKMGGIKMLNISDLHCMQNMKNTVTNMQEILDTKVVPLLTQLFDMSEKQIVTGLKQHGQIIHQNRYIYYISPVFKGNGYSELGIGFGLYDSPVLMVWIWIQSNCDNYSKIKELIHSHENRYNDDTELYFFKHLSDLLSQEEILSSINQWYSETLNKVIEFMNGTPQLDWKIQARK